MKKSNLGLLINVIGAAAVTTLVAIAPEAQAQRTCILDNQNRVICGRFYSQDDNGNNNSNRRAGVERAISTIYQDVLGRSADVSGLRTYSDRVLRNSWSYDRVRQDLVRSPEMRSAINGLYVEIFRRNADSEGLNTYLREIQNGRSLDWVRQQLANSGDGRGGDVEATISRIYQDVLGRNADASGLRTYSDRVTRNSWSYDRVRQELARSPEVRSAINQLYVQVLRRNADAGGMNTFLREVQNGKSLEWVRQELVRSDEARNIR